MVSSRYVRQTEEEMERLLSEKDSKNTKRAISTSVKCFRNYLQANGIDQEFESFEAGVLDGRSKEYYASVRKANDEHLKKSTLHTFRYGLTEVEIARLVFFFESFSLSKRSVSSSVCRTYLLDAMFFFTF
jgi:hypothetical protein